MNSVHPDLGELGPELRRLAQAILDAVDPAVRAAVTLVPTDGPGRCQQAWCPVCALAAVVTGEEHPLLTVIAEHSLALLAIIRAVVEPAEPQPDPPSPGSSKPAGDDGPGAPDDAAVKNGYQHIPVTVEE